MLDNIAGLAFGIVSVVAIRPRMIISTSDFPSDVIPAVLAVLISGKRVKWIPVIHHVAVVAENHRGQMSTSYLYEVWQRVSLLVTARLATRVLTHTDTGADELRKYGIRQEITTGISGALGWLTWADSADFISTYPKTGFHQHNDDLPANRSIELVFIGRATRNKGFEDIPRILETLALHGKHGRIRATASAARVRQLQESLTGGTAKSWRLEPLENLSDSQLASSLRNCDVVLLPSYAEGWAYSIYEAILSGCRVVAYDLPIFSETLGGLLPTAPVGDPVALAELISEICSESLKFDPQFEELYELVSRMQWSSVSNVAHDVAFEANATR